MLIRPIIYNFVPFFYKLNVKNLKLLYNDLLVRSLLFYVRSFRHDDYFDTMRLDRADKNPEVPDRVRDETFS